MSKRSNPGSPFTAAERGFIRSEFCRHFGSDPRLADGIHLRTWRSGSHKDQPKIPPAVQSMLSRDLLVLVRGPLGPAAFFTEARLVAMRQLVLDRRAMDPAQFLHLRVELGLDTVRQHD